ncbi:MAG: hypothetical protein O3A01_04145, partial [bacterium]|nr:hypothetical protein [bacterium]
MLHPVDHGVRHVDVGMHSTQDGGIKFGSVFGGGHQFGLFDNDSEAKCTGAIREKGRSIFKLGFDDDYILTKRGLERTSRNMNSGIWTEVELSTAEPQPIWVSMHQKPAIGVLPIADAITDQGYIWPVDEAVSVEINPEDPSEFSRTININGSRLTTSIPIDKQVSDGVDVYGVRRYDARDIFLYFVQGDPYVALPLFAKDGKRVNRLTVVLKPDLVRIANSDSRVSLLIKELTGSRDKFAAILGGDDEAFYADDDGKNFEYTDLNQNISCKFQLFPNGVMMISEANQGGDGGAAIYVHMEQGKVVRHTPHTQPNAIDWETGYDFKSLREYQVDHPNQFSELAKQPNMLLVGNGRPGSQRFILRMNSGNIFLGIETDEPESGLGVLYVGDHRYYGNMGDGFPRADDFSGVYRREGSRNALIGRSKGTQISPESEENNAGIDTGVWISKTLGT